LAIPTLLLATTLPFVGALIAAYLGRLSRRVQAYFAVFVAAGAFILVASLVPAIAQTGEVELDLP